MAGKQMKGDNTERRSLAKAVRDKRTRPSAVGAILGASKQRDRAHPRMSHQQRIDLIREGRHNMLAANSSKARPGSRHRDTPDRESHPRF